MMCIFPTPALEASRHASTFGIIPLSIVPAPIKIAAAGGVEVRTRSMSDPAVAENARRVGEKDEFLGLQMSGHSRGGGVGIDVQPVARRIERQRGNHRHDSRIGKSLDQVGVYLRHESDIPEVERLAIIAGEQQLLAHQCLKRIRMETHRSAAELADCADDAGVNFVAQHAHDYGESRIIGERRPCTFAA